MSIVRLQRMLAGPLYREVERWLGNLLASHAKRVSPLIELDFREVTDKRGSLAWCGTLADRATSLARGLLDDTGTADARAR